MGITLSTVLELDVPAQVGLSQTYTISLNASVELPFWSLINWTRQIYQTSQVRTASVYAGDIVSCF